MSTQSNDYVIYGYSVKWENTDWVAEANGDRGNKLHEVFESYGDDSSKVAEPGRFMVLYDGRDGRYTVFGIVICATDEGEGFSDLVTCETTPKYKRELTKKIEELAANLPPYYNLKEKIAGLKPKIYVTRHLR
jgi:hypothetical protein